MPPPPPRDETAHTESDRDFAHYRRTRDPEALGRVFDATAGKLLLVALHLVRDASAAEDVVQATFLAAMPNAEQYDPAQPLLPWLLGILTNQAAFAWRERRRQPDPERIAQPAGSDPARIAETRELADEVARAIDGIAAPYRQVAFRFADGGDYAFTFVLARTDGQWSVALPATPAVVAVRAAAGVQTFTFTTDDARLQQALLDLRGH